jgi:hypothetical protein
MRNWRGSIRKLGYSVRGLILASVANIALHGGFSHNKHVLVVALFLSARNIWYGKLWRSALSFYGR